MRASFLDRRAIRKMRRPASLRPRWRSDCSKRVTSMARCRGCVFAKGAQWAAHRRSRFDLRRREPRSPVAGLEAPYEPSPFRWYPKRARRRYQLLMLKKPKILLKQHSWSAVQWRAAPAPIIVDTEIYIRDFPQNNTIGANMSQHRQGPVHGRATRMGGYVRSWIGLLVTRTRSKYAKCIRAWPRISGAGARDRDVLRNSCRFKDHIRPHCERHGVASECGKGVQGRLSRRQVLTALQALTLIVDDRPPSLVG